MTNFWFTVLGGTGIFFELQSPGSISGPLNAAGLPAVLLASLSQLPFSDLLVPAFLVLTTTFVVTTGDSMAYSISMVVSGDNEPKKSQRLFWAIVMGLRGCSIACSRRWRVECIAIIHCDHCRPCILAGCGNVNYGTDSRDENAGT